MLAYSKRSKAMTYSMCQNTSCTADKAGASFAASIFAVIVSIAVAMLIFIIALRLPLLVVLLGVLLVLVVSHFRICPKR